MDAFKQVSLLESGTYYLIPEGADLAKMDALERKFILIPTTYVSGNRKDTKDGRGGSVRE